MHVVEQSTCFACGPDHPHGLRLVFTADAEGNQVTQWTASSEWEGFSGMIHGGILATLADEAMAKAVVARRWEAVTGKLHVRYHVPVTLGEQVVIRGWISGQQKRLIFAEATVHTTDGRLCLSANSTFVIIPGAPVTPAHR